MPRALDPKIGTVLKGFGFGPEAVWDCHGTWVVYHRVLEQIAAKAGIKFDMPVTLEANGATKSVALCVSGSMADKSEWSIGEASPANSKNAYPYAMAEKRGKDRVILKLIGLHGLAYSEEEADAFASKTPEPAPEPPPVPEGKQQYEDPDGQMQNWIDQQKKHLANCETVADVQEWVELREDAMKRLYKKNLMAWGELKAFQEARIREINEKAGVK